MPDTERVLETPRTRLEPLTASHAAHFYEPLCDLRLYKFYAGRPPQSVDELRAKYTMLAMRTSPDGKERWLNWAVRLREGAYVGRMQATIRGDLAIIGYDIFPDYWRMGYGKEAVAAMLDFLRGDCKVTSVSATVDANNEASIALLESLGFKRVWTGPSDDLPGRLDHRYERT